MTRDEIVDRLWEDSPLFLSRAEFQRTLEGWETHQVQGPGGAVLVVITKGPEFHFAIVGEGFHVTREHLRRWPGDLITRYGYAETKTPKEDARQRRFNERLGFEQVGEDEYDIHLRITRLRVKETACPSSRP